MRLRDAIHAYFDVIQENGDEWIIRCPHPDHADRKPSASLNIVKGLWICYSCGAAGSIRRTMEDIDIVISEPGIGDQLDELDSLLLDAAPRYLSESWLDQFDYGRTLIHDYWRSRGLSDDLIAAFRLGYEFESQSATYPMRDPVGRLLGVVRRSLGDGPKYRYPSGVKKSSLLFNYHNVTPNGSLVVVEGAVDALALLDVGIDAVALYGSRLHDEQRELINRLACSSVILCLDNDQAGRAATFQICESDLRGLLYVASPMPFKDIADVPKKDRLHLINDAELVF